MFQFCALEWCYGTWAACLCITQPCALLHHSCVHTLKHLNYYMNVKMIFPAAYLHHACYSKCFVVCSWSLGYVDRQFCCAKRKCLHLLINDSLLTLLQSWRKFLWHSFIAVDIRNKSPCGLLCNGCTKELSHGEYIALLKPNFQRPGITVTNYYVDL